MSEAFLDLGDAISDQRFVDVDLALRRGQHIDRDDADWYAYLLDAQAVLEPFYRRYGCELVQRADGYFFLLPTGDKVPRRLLGLPEMIVGQGAALLYLDPSTVESGGVINKDDLLSHLAAVMGTDALVAVFNPKRKRLDERVAQETVRQRVGEGLRKLAQLGFVTLSEDQRIHLRSALMRFADPVRGAGSPRDALEKLIARGEVSVPEEPGQDPSEDIVDSQDEEFSEEDTAVTDVPPEGAELAEDEDPFGDFGDATEDSSDETLDETLDDAELGPSSDSFVSPHTDDEIPRRSSTGIDLDSDPESPDTVGSIDAASATSNDARRAKEPPFDDLD